MKGLVYTVRPLGWVTCQWLKRLWPGCLTTAIGGLSLRTVPDLPLPGDDWVRVRTVLGGICGTDLAILQQKQPPDSILQAYSSFPGVLGHENVSVVEEVGPAVDADWLGRRVIVDPTLCCRVRGIDPPCAACREGRYGACESFADKGTGRYGLPPGTSTGYCGRVGGSWGEMFLAHVSQLQDVPEDLPDELAILTDPLACSMHAVYRARLDEARRVLVYGAGVLGLGVVAALRSEGYTGRIDVLNRSRRPEELAVRFGADEFFTLPSSKKQRFEDIAHRTDAVPVHSRFGNRILAGGYDVIFDCVGTATSLNESIKWAAARGQVVLVATAHGGRLDLTPVWMRELHIVGVFGRQDETVGQERLHTNRLVHRRMQEGKLSVGDLLTHTFPLVEYRTALRAAMHRGRSGAFKVAFDFRVPTR